jgi:hypothetical protein
MRWLVDHFDRWATKTQLSELADFVTNLKAIDSGEVATVVALATHVRHMLEERGHLVMDPIVYCGAHASFPLLLSKTIKELQKQGQPQLAVGFMVWLHTARAALRPELRQLGRDMWRELARGFSRVDETAAAMAEVVGVSLNTARATELPKGFTPDPL